jgi:uncharacterized protein
MLNPDDNFSARSRALSGMEFLLGAFVVICHNVLLVGQGVIYTLTNEVPILCVGGLVSIHVRGGGWAAIGLKLPTSWLRIVGIAVAAAALRILLGEFVIEPMTAGFWPPIIAPAAASGVKGNVTFALLATLFVWTFAAFGEEIAYRGYLLTRAADLGKRSTPAYWIGIVGVAILFGFGHYYKGPAGILDSGVAGLILGAAYMLSGRNLWASILAHGIIDTFGIVVLYFGLDS